MKGLIYLNLNAEAYYSGATYDETLFITPQDYLKYFCKNVGTEVEITEANKVYADDAVELTDENVKKAYQLAKQTWHEKEVYVGELDGKHSEVYGEVEVDLWDTNRIAEYWEKPNNDGTCLLDKLSYMINPSSYEDRKRFMDEIRENVNKVVESIGTKVTVSFRVPKDKVKELEAFAEKLNAE